MNRLIIFCIAVITLTACGNSQKRKAKQNEKAGEETTVIKDTHNARNSLNYYGVYDGIFPCADCEGIKTRVSLYKDGTYMIESVYLKNGERSNPISLKGKVTWNNEGHIITLEGARAKNLPAYFFVAEGRLIAVDENGKEIDSLSEHYILKQTEVF